MNKSLNTFRAFAFFGVFSIHCLGFGAGYLGVHAFFVLSGYLITPILIKTKENTADFKGFLINFYGRRALRIFPPYYFYLIILAIIVLLGGFNVGEGKDFFVQLPWAATYTYDFYSALKSFRHLNLLSHFWSLAVEEQFYIFWPLLVYFVPEKGLKKLFIALMILVPIARMGIGYLSEHNLLSFWDTKKDVVVYVLPFSHIDAFVIGGFFSVFVRTYTPSTRFIALCSIAIMAIGVITSKLFLHKLSLGALGYAPFMADSFKYVWGYTLFGFYFSLILLRLNKRDFFPIIFENNILNYLGKISYGLYIYHYAILEVVSDYLNSFHVLSGRMIVLLTAIITLLLTIIVSVLSFELFEKLFLHWKDKWFAKGRPKDSHGKDVITTTT